VQYTQADETPKAGLVVQVIPGHIHKVISLEQSENVVSKKKQKTRSSSKMCGFVPIYYVEHSN